MKRQSRRPLTTLGRLGVCAAKISHLAGPRGRQWQAFITWEQNRDTVILSSALLCAPTTDLMGHWKNFFHTLVPHCVPQRLSQRWEQPTQFPLCSSTANTAAGPKLPQYWVCYSERGSLFTGCRAIRDPWEHQFISCIAQALHKHLFERLPVRFSLKASADGEFMYSPCTFFCSLQFAAWKPCPSHSYHFSCTVARTKRGVE